MQAEIFILLKKQSYDVPSEQNSLASCNVPYAYGQWQSRQNLHVFWRKDDAVVPFRQQIDIYDFISFLINRGIVSDTNILASIDLGVEPIVGGGALALDSFYVTLQ